MNNISGRLNFFLRIENMARESYAIGSMFMRWAYADLAPKNKFMLYPIRRKKGECRKSKVNAGQCS
jgi:hypothetical protein